MESTYLLTYGYYLSSGQYISSKMRIKRCMSDLHAKIRLEQYLEKNVLGFSRLVVYTCAPDTPNPFGDIFGDIFGGFNKK
jgi:hypothetical protein